jgi:integrase
MLLISMKTRYRLIRRNIRGGIFYCVDTLTNKRESLKTTSEDDALQLIHAKNEALRQPVINRQIAYAYLNASDPEMARRTWQYVMDELGKLKTGATKIRWDSAMHEKPFDGIRALTLLQTRPEHFIAALESGTVSTNMFLRRLHNAALDMHWLPNPIIPRRQWPKIEFGERRAISWQEHQKILADERNPEWQAYYQLLWHLGGSQTDIATLTAEDIDWSMRVITFARGKSATPVQLHFGDIVAALLDSCPKAGPLFPMISTWKESDRGKAFIRRCKRVEVTGVSLHSYRYAWAERAKASGYPERFAQQALGHASKAVARAYAKKAQVKLPSLEEYEAKLVSVEFRKAE